MSLGRPLSANAVNQAILTGTYDPAKHDALAAVSAARNAAIGRPEKPYGFRPEYEPYWDMLCEALEQLGTLTVDHGPSILALSQVWYDYDQCSEKLREDGFVVENVRETKTGEIIVTSRRCHPLLPIRAKIDMNRRQWMNDLGLTPGTWTKMLKITAGERDFGDGSGIDPFAGFEVAVEVGRGAASAVSELL